MKIEFHGPNMTLESWWTEWFGLFGRELGTNRQPHRFFTDNPQDFLNHIKTCLNEGRPVWMSAQPMRDYGKPMGIEKLFYDFDDKWRKCPCGEEGWDLGEKRKISRKNVRVCPRCGQELTKDSDAPRLDVVAEEVKRFLSGVKKICNNYNFNPKPLIVKTFKGFHVYFFFYEVWEFQIINLNRIKELYKILIDMLIDDDYKFKFLDGNVKEIMRFARVPLTPHEKNGETCIILDENFNQDKVRNIDFFRSYGIPSFFVERGIEKLKEIERERFEKSKEEISDLGSKNGDGTFWHGKIRPCFLFRMEKGEMEHPQRLAWLNEIYYAGYNTEEKMLELCRETWNDFDEKLSLQQIRDFFKHDKWIYRPYRCTTLKKKGWCLGKELCDELRDKYNNVNKDEN